jgi:Na+-driven multidrug efflux pump
MKIKQFAMCPFDALATGVSTFCAQNLGAGRNDRIRTGVRKGVLIGILYGAGIGLVLIFFGRQMSLLFLKPDQTEILTASAQYLACMGYFYWALGILNVTRMVTQAIGYAGRAMVSGVIEMIARSAVATIFVPMFGFQAICWTDQAAWLTATLYITPVCYFSLRQAEKKRRI